MITIILQAHIQFESPLVPIQIRILQIRNLQIRILQIRNLQIRNLQIQNHSFAGTHSIDYNYFEITH